LIAAILGIILAIVWVIGAIGAVKLDAASAQEPSDWSDLKLALFAWPFIMLLQLSAQHVCKSIHDLEPHDYYSY
jgi:hypothetical protein